MKKKYLSVVGFGAILLGFSSILSRLLGVLRDHVFANVYGNTLDAYFLAFRIPDLIYNLLVFGAMSAAFVPIYAKLLQKNKTDADDFASEIFNSIFLLLLIISGLFFIFTPYILPFLAPGLNPADLIVSIELTRIMLFSPIFLGLSSVLQGIQNAKKVFFGISLAPIFYNLAIIISAYVFSGTYGLKAISYGVVLGSALHFLIQIPFIFNLNFQYKFIFRSKSKEYWNFIKLSIPRIFGLSVGQFGILIDTTIATLIGVGSLSILNFTINLQSLPYAVVAVSLSMAIFSTLSEQAGDNAKFIETIKKSNTLILFWVIPAILGVYLLRVPLVDFILKGGAFSQDSANLTALTLGIFIWATLPQSIIPLFARAFYALENTKIPVLSAFIAVLANMIIGLILTQLYSVPVWALAISAIISNSINALILIFSLSKKMGTSFSQFFDFTRILKILISTFIMTASVLTIQIFSTDSILYNLFLPGIIGFAVYFAISYFLKTIPNLHAVEKNLID